mmetsp:Transcript_53173/g.119872  ORF Transcript_53173/g.119872 Transcript_53173/m.119872 type:complete len:245 (+) Transcript_53173:88-822(+)
MGSLEVREEPDLVARSHVQGARRPAGVGSAIPVALERVAEDHGRLRVVELLHRLADCGIHGAPLERVGVEGRDLPPNHRRVGVRQDGHEGGILDPAVGLDELHHPGGVHVGVELVHALLADLPSDLFVQVLPAPEVVARRGHVAPGVASDGVALEIKLHAVVLLEAREGRVLSVGQVLLGLTQPGQARLVGDSPGEAGANVPRAARGPLQAGAHLNKAGNIDLDCTSRGEETSNGGRNCEAVHG